MPSSYNNNSTSFAKHAARTALANNNNITNLPPANAKHLPKPPTHQPQQQDTEIDKIVESVTNATKRLSQISTNTNSSKRKSKNHVGPWKLGRTLGRGSTGRVRLAKHSETGQLAAVKIVPKSKFQKNENGQESNTGASPYGIEREIIIMKLISHENVMGLYDVWENKGELYLVLEYVEGGELFDYLIKKGRLQEKEAIHYFQQIINGVSYCHQFNICHRDLKPENLLLDKNLNIKIADFGMAALEINSKLLETSCGSPHYASPEIVTGKNYHGSPSDVWSCGIILFALLTGHLPFDDENIRKLLIKVQTGKFIMPNYLSKDAKDLIWKMLKVNPMERIKIQDILKHPLLTKYNESTSSNKSESLNDYYSKIDHMKLSRDDIDNDILKSLSILFHGATQATLIPKLLDTNSNPEKIFYYLLNSYKQKHQLKQDKAEIAYQNSKKKIGNGDGLLKKSKSLIKTTITNQDGSTTINYAEQIVEKPINTITPSISTTSKKRKSKNPNGQIEIPVSTSHRRGVSFNNQKESNMSRSSSKKSFTSINEKLKKNISLLPPLPDLGIDWLELDNKTTSKELATLCEEIFNFDGHNASTSLIPPTPKSKVRAKQISPPKRISPRKQPFVTSSPLRQQNTSPVKPSPLKQTSPTRIKQEEEKIHIPRQLGNFEINNKRFSSEPVSSKPKTSTLDPKYKKRGISNDNAQVLSKIGVNLERRKSSKIFYSKSSTSVNLAAILKKEESRNLPPPLPTELRKSSSNYDDSEIDYDYDEDDSFNTTTHHPIQHGYEHDVSFDFEVPTKTEIATAIHFSNGSNVTFQNKNPSNKFLKDESIFEDVATLQNENFLRLSSSRSSMIKHHKRATSNGNHIVSPSMDIRGSLYNNPSDLAKDDIPHPMVKIPTFTKKQSILEENDETKSTILDNSLFADNTIDDIDLGTHKRITTIFDDNDDGDYEGIEQERTTPIKVSPFNEPTRRPSQLKRSPLRSINDAKLRSSIVTPKVEESIIDLNPQRVAPSAPNESAPKKINWFSKIFANLINSSNTNSNKPKINKHVKTFHSNIPMMEIHKAIKLILQIRVKEGTLSLIKETSNSIIAKVPSQSLSKPLKFEIKFHYNDSNNIELIKLNGPVRVFKKLINALQFVIESEEQRYLEDHRKSRVEQHQVEIPV